MKARKNTTNSTTRNWPTYKEAVLDRVYDIIQCIPDDETIRKYFDNGNTIEFAATEISDIIMAEEDLDWMIC